MSIKYKTLDDNALGEWIASRPEERRTPDGAIIAHRAAMRALPAFLDRCERQEWDARWTKNFQLLPLPVLQQNLITGVLAQVDIWSKKTAIEIANNVWDNGARYASTEYAAEAAIYALAVAAGSQKATTEDTVYAASLCVRFKGVARNEGQERFWIASAADVKLLENVGYKPLERPLWIAAPSDLPPETWGSVQRSQPSSLKECWQRAHDWLVREQHFDFWIRWYEAALAGEPLTSGWNSHWKLLSEIALIPDADWDQGAEHIAGLIAAIEARFALPEDMMLARALPLAESVEINPESGKFRVVPVPVQNTPLIGAVLARAADALDDALGGNSGLTDASREARVIRRVISRYGNDPQRIEMDFVSVAAGMRRQFENGDLPEDEMNLGLFEAVEEGVRAIRASHADVAENRAVLAGQRVAEMTAEERALMQEALPMLIEASEGALAMEFDEDIAEMLASPLVADRAPIGGKAPPLPGMVRTFSRVAKISLLDRSSQVISKVDGSAGYKGLRMIGTGKSIIDLVRLGLDWFGVI